MKDKVSVIIPTYNNEKYICKCIDSVISQTYNNLEIIIINDGSKDNTDNIIKKKYNSIKNIRYFCNENKGVSYSRNYGINVSTGEYIMFLDGDDWLEKNYIKNCLCFLKKNNIDIVRTGFNIIKNDGIVVKKVEIFDESVSIISCENIEKIFLNSTFFNSCCTQLLKKSIIKNIKFSENIFCGEDLLFCLSILKNNPKIGYINSNFYNYFQNEESVTKVVDANISLKKCLNIIKVINEFYLYNFEEKLVAFKMYYEIEHYLRRFILESTYSIKYYNSVIKKILKQEDVLKAKQNFVLKYNKEMFKIKKWLLVCMLYKIPKLYTLLVIAYKKYHLTFKLKGA